MSCFSCYNSVLVGSYRERESFEMDSFVENVKTAFAEISSLSFLQSTKGLGIFIALTVLFIIGSFGFIGLMISGSFRDALLQWNDYLSGRKGRYKADYEYLVGLVYFDKTTEMTHCTTRIANRGARIVAYRERVENNQPVGGEQDGAIDVADVEHYLGLYLSGSASPKKEK